VEKHQAYQENITSLERQITEEQQTVVEIVQELRKAEEALVGILAKTKPRLDALRQAEKGLTVCLFSKS